MNEFDKVPDFPSDGCAIVFGGSGGLGQSTARLLAARGSPVVVTYRAREKEAGAVVKQILDHGCKAMAVRADVRDPKSLQAATAAAVAKFGRIHTVISAGGLAFGAPDLAD